MNEHLEKALKALEDARAGEGPDTLLEVVRTLAIVAIAELLQEGVEALHSVVEALHDSDGDSIGVHFGMLWDERQEARNG